MLRNKAWILCGVKTTDKRSINITEETECLENEFVKEVCKINFNFVWRIVLRVNREIVTG